MSCHILTIRMRFGSNLSINDTAPPSYEDSNAPTVSDSKGAPSSPQSGNSATSEILDHPAPTLDVQVFAPTETFTRGSIFMEKVCESLPKLSIAKQRHERDFERWRQAFQANMDADKSNAHRLVSDAKLKEVWSFVSVGIVWAEEEGEKWSDLQDFMSKVKIDGETQRQVQNLWEQASEARAEGNDC